jgi:uncharacterized membrane protein
VFLSSNKTFFNHFYLSRRRFMIRRSWILLFIPLLLLILVVGGPPVLAQEGQQQEGGQPATTQPLVLFTRYPSQEMAIGDNVTFELVLRTGTTPQVVRLEAQDLPEGWTASFRGGGKVVQSAYVEPENETKVDLRLEPPSDVAAGVYSLAVVARSEDEEVELPLELTVKDKLPPSLGLDVELPTLRGTPSTTFRYNVTLKNDGDEDLTVNLVAEAPQGFQVNFQLTGQDVTSVPLAADESKRLNVEVKLFPDTPAGTYQVNVLAQGGEAQATTTLTAEVTGQPEMSVTAPDGRLSGQAYVGQVTPLKLIVQNAGSAPARNVELTASQPAGWKVEFDPAQIAEIPSGEQVEVTANIQPAEQAIAGDYVVTVRARPEDGPNDEAQFRITVLTSTLWGMVGVGLIAVAVAVVGLAVVRFGRR